MLVPKIVVPLIGMAWTSHVKRDVSTSGFGSVRKIAQKVIGLRFASISLVSGEWRGLMNPEFIPSFLNSRGL